MNGYTPDERDEQMTRVRRVADAVSVIVGRYYEWIALQKSKDYDDLYGVAWRGFSPHGSCAVRASEADADNKQLVIKLATEVMGYPPNGFEHLSAQYQRLREGIDRMQRERSELDRNISGAMLAMHDVSMKMHALAMTARGKRDDESEGT